MRIRVAVIAMAALLALYLVFAVRYGLLLIGTGESIAIGLGVALLVLPVLAAGLMAAEIVFAVRAEGLARQLEKEGGLPQEQLPTTTSGRVLRSDAQAVFPAYQAAVEADPENWRPWFRLALAYDASGDRRRARWATRTAIRLSRGVHAAPDAP